MMSKQNTAQVLAVLSAGFPHVTVTKETARVYHEVLVDLDPEDVMKAITRLMKTSEWFPPAALIRRTTMEVRGVLAQSSHSAWGEVLTAVREHGFLRFPSFSDPLLTEAVRLVGWRTICYSDKPEVIKSQFGKVYDELKESHDQAILVGEVRKELANEKIRAVETEHAFEANSVED